MPCRDRRASSPVPALPCSCNRRDRAGRIDLANAIVVRVGDVDVARAVHRNIYGAEELRLNRWPPVTAEKPAALAGSRDRGDGAREIHPANAVVVGIGNIEVPPAVHRNATRVVERRLNRRAPVLAEPAHSCSCDRRDRAGGIDLTNAVVAGIGNIEVAHPVHRNGLGSLQPFPLDRGDNPCGIDLTNAVVAGIGNIEVAHPVHRNAPGVAEPRLNRRPPVTSKPAHSCSCNRRDRAGRIDLANAIVTVISNVEVPAAVHRNAPGVVEPRLNCRPPVTSKPVIPRSCNRRDRAGRIDLANAVVAGIGNIEVARTVQRNTLGVAEPRLNRRAPVTSKQDVPRTCNRRDRAGGIDFANEAPPGIGDVDVAPSVYRNSAGLVERHLIRRDAFHVEPAGECGDGELLRSARPRRQQHCAERKQDSKKAREHGEGG